MAAPVLSDDVRLAFQVLGLNTAMSVKLSNLGAGHDRYSDSCGLFVLSMKMGGWPTSRMSRILGAPFLASFARSGVLQPPHH